MGFLCAANPSAWAAPALGPGGPLPLAFEPNEGQADPGVKFLARGRGYGLFFTPSETVLVLTPPDARVSGRRPFASPKSSPPSVVRMRLVGAEAAATIAGLDRLPGHTHYLVGEASRWRRDVPTFARIRYGDVYPGVSLVFYGSERQLEYDFIVAPGADPSVVALAFDGADALRLDEQGDLLITTAAGEVRLRRPAIYQEQDGERRPVDGGYVLDGGRVRFRVAAWDASRPLVIDPVLGYSSYLGGAAVDQGFGVAIDAVGNAYVTGATASTNFPVSATPFQRGRGALTDAFVVKVDPSGAVVYSTYLGGAGVDAGHAIAVDANGNAYVTGTTTSGDFPIVGPFQPTLQGGQDAFVTKLSVDGGSLVYSTFLGGEGDDLAFGIALDAGGAAYVTGSTTSTTFPNNNAVICLGSRSGASDAFVAKVDVTGSSLGYCAFVGGSADETGSAIAADGAGNAWIVGSTTSDDLPVVGGLQTQSGGGTDAFVANLDTTGAVVYLTYLGGSGDDDATAVAVDAGGNAYVTGSTSSPNFPGASGFQAALAGGTDAFVTKLSPAGDALVFSTYLGGFGNDVGNAIAVNPVDGSVYVAGSTNSTDFPTESPIQDRLAGGLDVFLTKLDPTGGTLVYSTYLGGTGDDAALALAVDGSGVAFLTGSTGSTTFPATPGQALAGLVDAFVTQVGDGGIIQFTGASYQVAENGGSITIGVQRTGDSTALVKVDYLTSDGTATAGANYLPASGTLTFAPGQIVATFTVTILDDTIGEGDQTVNLTLRNAGGGAVLGTRRSATLTIVDNEPAINFSVASYNVQENKGPAVITVARSGPAAGTVTVRFTTSDGPGASAPGRYAAVNTTLTFAPGVRSLKASVPIVNDTLAQGNGIVNLTLSNVSGGTPPAQLGVRSSATLNIIDDDLGGSIQFSKPVFTVTEPATGTVNATITVTRVAGAASGVTVDYAVNDGLPPDGASAGRNYLPTTGTLSFGAAVASRTFVVPVRNDGAATGNLSAVLTLANPTGGAILGSTPSAQLTIVDSAPRVSFSTAAFTVREGTPTATITVVRIGATTAAATVDFTTSDGSAAAGVDYQAVAGTLSFAAGVATKTFTVRILNDSSVHGSRTVLLTLGNPTGVSIVPPAQATLTITDDDAGGAIQFAGPSFVVAQGASPATITLIRSGGAAGGVSAQFATSDGTAVSGTDYTPTAGIVTFGPGETTKTFPVTILVPPTVAGVRTVNLSLSAPAGGATLGVRTNAVLRIVDQLALAFGAATYTVGEGGGFATITVELTGANLANVTVDYAASDGSAHAPADYRPTAGTLTFPPGGTPTSVRTKTFTVPVLQNTRAEGTKTVNLSLSNPTGGATLVTAPTNRSTAVLSITDDDQGGAVAFAAASFSVLENAGPATIGVKRTLGSASGVTVHYATTDGTATAGLRYTPTSGTLTFGFGETLKTFTVPVVNDTIGQGPQTVNLTLSSATGGGTLGGPSTAVLTILDDDPYISLSAPAYSVSEGAGALTVTVQRGGDLSRQATIDYATADQPAGTPHRAIAGVDYTVTTGTLTFAPSVATQTFTVPILNNSLPQPDRTFVVLVRNAAITGLPPATVSLIAPVAAVVTIKDDDVGGAIQWSAPTYTVHEDGGEAILTLTRLGGRAGGVSVRVQTHNVGFVPPGSPAPPAQTATAGANYTSTDLRVTFGPGDTTKPVRIPILNDGTATGNQTVYVEVSDPQPSGATGSPVLGSQTLTTLTIVDAQPSVQFPVATFTATEGTPAATVTVQRTAPAGRLTVDFATSSGTATAPANYLNTAGTLVFPDGVTTQSFTVPLVDNQLVEADKQFTVTLSNLQPPAAATLGPRLTATVTIKEDDRGGTFSVFGGAILEGAKNQNSTFLATVSRTGGSGGPVTVDFRVDECGHFPGTSACLFPATRVVDFDPIVTTLTFQAGELSKTIPVIVHGNDVPEGSRNFQLSLTNPLPHGLMQDGKEIGAQIGGGETLVQIVEDDLYFVTLSSETYGASEGAREFRVPVVRSGTSNFLSNSLTVDMVAVAITALVGQDYVSLGAFDGMSSLAPASAGRCSGLSGRDVVARQNVVFAANETTQTFRVPFLDDTVVDGPKTIFICINDATNTGTPNGPGIAFPAAATLTVNDDDNGGTIQFGSDTYVVPDNAGQAIITLTRTGNPNLASGVSVTAQTGDLFAATTPPQTGAAGTDYTSTNATVTFNVGETTASFAVPLLGNGGAGTKTVNLQIGNPQPVGPPGSPTIGTRKAALLQIIDAVQTVDFTLANYDVSEAAGQATIVLERGGDLSGQLTVDFATSDNTAFAGVDYSTVATTVTFAPLASTATVTVPIIDNKVVNGDKVVNLTLSNPSAPYGIATGRGTATLTLKDDDVGGAIGFAAATFVAQEGAGQAVVTLVRSGGTAGCSAPLTVPTPAGGSCAGGTVITVSTADAGPCPATAGSGFACAGTDYTATTTTVEFGAGETVKTVAVPLLNAGRVDGMQSFNVTLTNPLPGGFAGHSPTTGGIATAAVQIVETELRISASAFAATENGARATITVVRTGDLSAMATVDFATVDGTAIAGADYTATNGTLTFAPPAGGLPGESVKTFDVVLTDDSLFEGDESFTVVFSNPTGATIDGDACVQPPTVDPVTGLVTACAVTVTIVDNDLGGVIEFSKDTFDVAENAGTATITVKRTLGGAGCPLPLTVPTPPGGSCPTATLVTVSTADGTATAGTDYTATTALVEFGSGEVTKTVGVPVLNNTTGVLTASLSLTNATGGAAIGDQGSATLRIIDANDSVAFTAIGYTVGEAGLNALVTVRRTGQVGNVLVDFLTSPGTATAGADYTAVSGTLTLPAATVLNPITTRTIAIPIINDALIEANETFTVRLRNLVPGTATFDASGCDPASPATNCDSTVTIIDDDQGGVIAFDKASYTVAENAGSASILLRRIGALGGPVSVTFATSDACGAAGAACAGTDYTAVNTSVTFAAGQTLLLATVPIIDNAVVSPPRTLNLTISTPVPAGFAGSPTLGTLSAATLTINDDEARVKFVTPTLSAFEGPSSVAVVTLVRTGNPAAAVTVNVATSDGGACPAALGAGVACAGIDYTTVNQVVSFAAGVLSRTVNIPILDNSLLDGDRALNVTLSGAVNAGIVCGGADAATCTVPLTIHDDDRAGSIAFDASQYTIKEDATALTVTITRTGGKGAGVAVSYAAIDDTAVNGTDYTAAATVGAPGSVTFLANDTAKTVSIPITNRPGVQGRRRFFLVLCDGSVCAPAPSASAALAPPVQASVTILDKDAEQTLQFSAAAYTVSEAQGSAMITVQRLGNLIGTVTVAFTTSDNSGVAGVDYTHAGDRTLTFLAGVRTQTASVPIINNTRLDGDRAINLTLSGAVGAGITCGGGAAVNCTVPLTILDDDSAGLVQFSAATYRVIESAPTVAITLTRSGGTAGPVSVGLVLEPAVTTRVGTPAPNPVVFGAGVLTQIVTIPVVGNTIVDGNQDIVLRLVNPTGGVGIGARDTATLTIVDDDVAGIVQFAQTLYTVSETAGVATITLTRTGGAATGVTIDYVTSDQGGCPPPPGTAYACAGTNYMATSGTATFVGGQASFPVTVLNDGATTGNVPLTLTLSNPSRGATLGPRAVATLKILDTQASVGFNAASYSVAEGASAAITVERTGPAGLPGVVVVHYATIDGTATSAGLTPDYRATAGNLTFNPGVATATFSVPTIGNTRQDGNRTLTLTLTPVSPGAPPLIRSTATVTIVDNDFAGALSFGASTFASSEFGFVTLSVHRPTTANAGPVTVAYATVDGTAKAGIDYQPTAGVLTFGPGVLVVSFTIPVLPNTLDNPDRSFTVALSSPTGGATLGTPSTATVQIHNNDIAGTVQFSVVAFSAATTCAAPPCLATLSVKRFGGGASGVTVDWATVDGTGNALHEYVPVTDQVSFGASEFLKTIFVELRPGATPGTNFGVILSNPEGGAILGTQSTATVTLH